MNTQPDITFQRATLIATVACCFEVTTFLLLAVVAFYAMDKFSGIFFNLLFSGLALSGLSLVATAGIRQLLKQLRRKFDPTIVEAMIDAGQRAAQEVKYIS